jgi:DNA-binding IclR family transcriptional regulator
MTNEARPILDALKAMPMSVPQLVEVTGLADVQVRDYLRDLMRLGKIERWTFDGHATVYRLAPA